MSFKDSVIGTVPCEWEILSISEVSKVSDSLHQTPTYLDNGIPMVRVTDIREDGLVLENCFKVSDETYQLFTKNHKPTLGDIVISRVGTYGVFSYVNTSEKFCLGQNTAIISPKINSKYLYYNLLNRRTKNQIDNFAVGSTQKTISLKNIKSIKIPICDEKEQIAIADTLTCLDDKIEFNNRINKTLEEMAQAIFKSWFVDFEPFQEGEFEDSELGRIPKGWRVGTVGDFIKLNYGKALPAKNRKAGVVKVYSSAGHTAFHNEALVNDMGIIVGRKGTIGTVYFEPNPFFCIDTAYYITTDNCRNQLFYTIQLLKYLDLTQYNEDSAVPGLNRNTVYAIKVVIPPQSVVSNCNEMFQAFQKQITANNEQNQTLTALRESLLPKLMSGEIRVPIKEV